MKAAENDLLIVYIISFFVFFLTCNSAKDDRDADRFDTPPFSSWNHFRGGQNLDGVNHNATVADSYKPAWTFKADGAILSSPVTDGARVYFGSLDKHLYALNIRTGELLWKFEASDEIEASPVIHNDMILIGDLGGKFYSLSISGYGRVIWQFVARDKIAGAANIITERNLVIFGSYDNHLYALNIDNGELAWKYKTESFINGTPATDNARIVFGGCDAGLHIVRAHDGALINKVDAMSYIAGSAVLRDNFAYVGIFRRKLLGIDIAENRVAWSYENDGRKEPFVASPALIDTFLVAPSRDNFVHCVSSRSGNLIWKFATRGAVDASPVIANGRVVAGCTAGTLYIIDLTTGEPVNSFDMGGPLVATPLLSGSAIIVADENGVVTALFPTP